jgi:hypothetical protein
MADVYRPLGPYKGYDKLPSTPNKTLVDIRTGVPYGQYTEEEIEKDIEDVYSVATLTETTSELVKNRGKQLVDAVDTIEPDKQLKLGIGEVFKHSLSISHTRAKASELINQYINTGDQAYKEEAKRLNAEADSMEMELPESFAGFGILHETSRTVANASGFMSGMAEEKIGPVLESGVIGATAGAVALGASILAGAPIASSAILTGAAIGLKGGLILHMLDYTMGQGRAEMFTAMVDDEDPIPESIAKEVSGQWAPVYGASETLGMIAGIGKAAGLTSSELARVKGIGLEGGTEALQQLTVQLSKYFARKKFAQAKGVEFTESIEDAIDTFELQQSTRAGVLAAAGLGLPGASYNTAKFSIDALKQIEKTEAKRVNQRQALKEVEVQKMVNKQVDEVADKPVVPVKEETTSKLVEGVDILDEEIAIASKQDGVKATALTDGDIDDLTIASEEDADALLDEAINKTSDSVSDNYADFVAGLSMFLEPKQVTYIEKLVDARASALGYSASEYIDARKVELQLDETDVEGLKGQITFTKEGSTIIKAFQGADVSTAVHELSHLFISDLQGQDLDIASEWVGIDKGAKWDTDAHEKLARGFERYLQNGQAPTQELAGLFNKFSRWLTEVYRTIKGSDIDVQITPEIRGVFDRMLTGQAEQKAVLDRGNVENLTLQQRQTRIEENWEDDQKRIAAEAKARRLHARAFEKELKELDLEGLTPEQVAKKALKIQRRLMQIPFDNGDLHGYNIAKNKFKAMLSRERKRIAQRKVHTALKNRIQKRLKDAQPKPRSGKVTSRMAQKHQEAVTDLFNEFSKYKTRKQIVEGYEKHVMDIDEDALLSPTQVLRNAYLDAAVAVNSTSVLVMQEIYKTINDVIAHGTSQSFYYKNAQRANGIVDSALNEVNGGNVIDTTTVSVDSAHRVRKEQKKKETLRQRLATMMIGQDVVFGLNGLLGLVSSYSNKPNGESILESELSFFKEKQAKLTEKRTTLEYMQEQYMRIFGIAQNGVLLKDRDYNEAVREDTRPQHTIGTKEGALWSTSQLRQIWMYMQDKTLDHRLNNMDITEEVRNNIDDILSDNDKVFAQSLMGFFASKEQYDKTNEVYISMFGVALPRIKNYVPLISEALRDTTEALERVVSQFKHDRDMRRTATSSGRLKGRSVSADKAKLHIQGDMSLFSSYVEEMSHFRNYAHKGALANAVLTDKDLVNAIKVEYGSKVYDKNIMPALKDVLADGMKERDSYTDIDKFRAALVASQVGASVTVMAKQHISVLNYWQHMPADMYMKYFLKFIKNPRKNMEEMWATDFLKNRRSGIDRDLQSSVNSYEYEQFQLNPSYKNLMTLNVTLGDSSAIAIGGWCYKEYLKAEKGLTEKEAQAVVAEQSNKTQQSPDVEERSRLQRGGSIVQLLTMYSTGPIQAMRQELQAIRGYAGRRISGKQAAKTLFIYHVLVPAMYSLTASVIAGDDAEDTAKQLGLATILGPMGSAYSVGRGVSATMRGLFGLTAFQNQGPFSDTISKVIKIANKVAEGDFEDLTADDYAKSMEALLAIKGYGVPVSRVTRSAQNLIEGDVPGAVFATKPD